MTPSWQRREMVQSEVGGQLRRDFATGPAPEPAQRLRMRDIVLFESCGCANLPFKLHSSSKANIQAAKLLFSKARRELWGCVLVWCWGVEVAHRSLDDVFCLGGPRASRQDPQRLPPGGKPWHECGSAATRGTDPRSATRLPIPSGRGLQAGTHWSGARCSGLLQHPRGGGDRLAQPVSAASARWRPRSDAACTSDSAAATADEDALVQHRHLYCCCSFSFWGVTSTKSKSGGVTSFERC